MHDILCIYYSRSGNTRAAAEEIAAALDAELAEITDSQDRSGLKGYFRSGLDAMRRARFSQSTRSKRSARSRTTAL